MGGDFKKIRDKLDKKLQSAFRYGNSAFRLGLMPQNISDHLPIQAALKLNPSDEQSHTMLSWNLLADEHLYNNFMNITGYDLIETDINALLDGEDNNIYGKGQMYHLFVELGRFLMEKAEQDTVLVNEALLNEFASLDESGKSRKALSRDPHKALLNKAEVFKARDAMVKSLLDETNPNVNEYLLSLQHCMEMMYQVEHKEGSLKWANRFEQLKDNQPMLESLREQDIIALQECTSPEDIQSLFEVPRENKDEPVQYMKDMTFISHHVGRGEKSTDNAVIAFDNSKYELLDLNKSNFEGKKPAIYAKLLNKSTNEAFIVGSIHHPGGMEHDHRQKISENVEALQNDDQSLQYFIAGDFNHTLAQFKTMEEEATANGLTSLSEKSELHYPRQGSMAGNDYNNTNQSIDLFMTGQGASIEVERIHDLAVSPPAAMPLSIEFALPGNVLRQGSPKTVADDFLAYDVRAETVVTSMASDTSSLESNIADQKSVKKQLKSIKEEYSTKDESELADRENKFPPNL